jgi:hypothetical protein
MSCAWSICRNSDRAALDQSDRKRDGMPDDVIAEDRAWVLQHSPI